MKSIGTWLYCNARVRSLLQLEKQVEEPAGVLAAGQSTDRTGRPDGESVDLLNGTPPVDHVEAEE